MIRFLRALLSDWLAARRDRRARRLALELATFEARAERVVGD